MLQECGERRWELVRGFSSLGRLQARSVVTYACEKMEESTYRFTMMRHCGTQLQQESTSMEGLAPWEACQITQFLYENAVPLDNWQDVLLELRGRL